MDLKKDVDLLFSGKQIELRRGAGFPLLLIGLVGPARAGKDTVAEHLAHRYGFLHLKFSRALKEFCMKAFRLSLEQVEGSLKDAPDHRWLSSAGVAVTPREILQIIGTQGFRAVDPDYWIKHLMDMVDEWLAKGAVPLDAGLVFSDVRFKNEAAAIRARGGKIIRIRREDQLPVGVRGQHESETELWAIEADAEIVAPKGDLDFLREGVDDVLGLLRGEE